MDAAAGGCRPSPHAHHKRTAGPRDARGGVAVVIGVGFAAFGVNFVDDVRKRTSSRRARRPGCPRPWASPDCLRLRCLRDPRPCCIRRSSRCARRRRRGRPDRGRAAVVLFADVGFQHGFEIVAEVAVGDSLRGVEGQGLVEGSGLVARGWRTRSLSPCSR